MHQRYGEAVSFFVVYIQEAHTTDGWQVPDNEREDVLFEQPKSAEEREAVAAACMVGEKVSIPTLIDEMTNEVDRAYAALPDRLYLIDGEGRIAYKSGPGPMGFKPQELEAAIRGLVDSG